MFYPVGSIDRLRRWLTRFDRAEVLLHPRRSPVAVAVVLLLFVQGVAVLQRVDDQTGIERGSSALGLGSDPTARAQTVPGESKGESLVGSRAVASAKGGVGTGLAKQNTNAIAADATGVTENEIEVAYYWKADATQNSQYLPADSLEGAVDEGEAFRKLTDWINKHSTDAAPTFLGFRYNLHGRKLKPIVLEAGRNPTDYGATADRIANKEKPFAAISSHGSLSAYVCPALAEHRILNLSTYNLDWGLYPRTNNYCVPQGLPWDSQVEAMTSYLRSHAKTKFHHPMNGQGDRVYGFAYWEYPGLVESAPKVVERFRAAGIPVASVKSMEADTVTAQRQAPFILEEFRAAGVNTVIMPDGGAPLALTHAAAANREELDYVVWPCSGQDTTAMVRLFDHKQWSRASGLSCWDHEFDTDLTNDQKARGTEWYRMYQEIAGSTGEPPSATPYVALSLLGLLTGVTHAGEGLNDRTFHAGLQKVKEFRYNAVTGLSNSPESLLLTFGWRDGTRIGDLAKVRWDPTLASAGAAGAGGYRYLDGRRYRPTEPL